MFKSGETNIEGDVGDSFLIHVFMYPMDFIASNIHALFKEYYNEKNPILSISIEHLFAMIIDAHKNDVCLNIGREERNTFKSIQGCFLIIMNWICTIT